jgi:polar amino acid transport system substrate-binding protein
MVTIGMLTAGSAAADNAPMKELAPTGIVRIGIAYAPSATPLFVQQEAGGGVRGPSREIGMTVAKTLGVDAELVVKKTTAELAAALNAGAIDIAFMPVDEERKKILDFSPPYYFSVCTYLVSGASGIHTMAEVDRPGITVVGIDGSTTFRAAGRLLTQAKVVAAGSIDEAMAIMRAGKAQAFALTHDSLPALQPQVPGSRILDGAFKVNGVAIAVQKGHPAALAYVTGFMQHAKADGTIRRALDAGGFEAIPVAP